MKWGRDTCSGLLQSSNKKAQLDCFPTVTETAPQVPPVASNHRKPDKCRIQQKTRFGVSL